MTKVIVVNQDDHQIGFKEYADLKYEDIYRVTALWLTDQKTGDCLITQRKWTKRNDPGKWMSAVSGTVEEGESYDENIVHEIEEEIGLKNLHLDVGPKQFVDESKHKYFVQWYLAEIDKETVTIVIQEDEVESFAWMPKDQLLKELMDIPNKFVPSLQRSLKIMGVSSA